ncbi:MULTISPECIES: restriction endonuclease subunit S [Klebsiella]|uniref:restriction endonuclease subunit S n=1 Tax=Klebsiella TaxID=570 RepID=UPI0008E41BD1|nr:MULTISPECIES: restriction endonuclease subunit S [Klebsiella]HCB1243628.1 restriction endonuclease subunit S [Klebsiella quasipneumoniae subsp. quasipneumoniae]MDK1757446.1 restriction endonuclease subunit S [Klebsiella sp. K5-322]MDK1842657.1 restriction endonuclease subunit S [Klebsiella sp. K5-204]UPS73161.1 restriction endonuclease subunit S [Klebsiella quasipneumoniae]SFG81175.1 type I restriction enzyme, S subunit [Klebsiella quasipneumoniae]
MAKYKAYPEYKDSGVEWLGMVPSHWNIKRLGQLFEERRDKVSDKDYPPLSVTMQGIVPQIDTAAKTDAGDNRKLVLKNDFVINSRSDRKGSSGVSQLNGSVSLISIVMEPKRINPKFAHHLLRSYPFQEEFYRYGKGIVADLWSTNSSEMKNILIPELADDESNAIACFLDHETAKIDNLIEKQQLLIELLKEKRQAVISHAVTKGLNPDVPMIDSGVEWLGEIPQHWGVTRLKYECRNIVDCPHSTPNYTDEGEYPAIRTADILAGYLDLENCRRVTEPVYDERNFRLIPKAGDIIYSREGERFGIGAPIPEGVKVCLAQRVMLFRAKSTPGYLMWALNSSSTYTQAQQDCIGSTSPHVNVDTIKNFILAWPPENEREEISKFIHQTLDSVESLTAHLTEKLTLLQERRTALISAAVTGKIDVRDWVAPDTQDVEASQEATA